MIDTAPTMVKHPESLEQLSTALSSAKRLVYTAVGRTSLSVSLGRAFLLEGIGALLEWSCD